MKQQQNSPAATSAPRVLAPEEAGLRPFDPALPLPNFFIVGAAKAGTTSLHAYLSKHPQVFMSERKEPHYFAWFELQPQFDAFMPPIRDPKEYQKLFLGSEGRKAVGEASPSYLCDRDAARRIKDAVPHAKIIISVRNPVQRAYSAYLMEFHGGHETLPFKEALEADRPRPKRWGYAFQYVELGLYTEQIERYYAAFGRANVLVILFEDLIRNTAFVMQQVARFLEIDPNAFPESAFEQVHNPFERSRGRLARAVLRWRSLRLLAKRFAPQALRDLANQLIYTSGEKEKMDDEVRRSLAARFAPELDRLERLLERDLGVLREKY
jgi:hypothetical protein